MPKPIEMLGLGPKREVAPQSDGSFKIYVTPPEQLYPNHGRVGVHLSADQYDRYCKWRIGGGLIQDHLSDLSPDIREILISGLTQADFDAMKTESDNDNDC